MIITQKTLEKNKAVGRKGELIFLIYFVKNIRIMNQIVS